MLTSATRHFLVSCMWGVVSGGVAIFFFTGAIDAFVEARTNTIGGYIPVYTRHGEVVDKEWVGPEQYRRAKEWEGIEEAILTVVAGVISMAFFFSASRPPKEDLHQRSRKVGNS